MRIKKLFQNKRADISITLLVMGIFVLCTATILSFYFSSVIVRDATIGLEALEKLNSNVEKAYSSINWENFEENPFDYKGDIYPGDKNCFYSFEREKDLSNPSLKFYAKYCRIPKFES